MECLQKVTSCGDYSRYHRKLYEASGVDYADATQHFWTISAYLRRSHDPDSTVVCAAPETLLSAHHRALHHHCFDLALQCLSLSLPAASYTVRPEHRLALARALAATKGHEGRACCATGATGATAQVEANLQRLHWRGNLESLEFNYNIWIDENQKEYFHPKWLIYCHMRSNGR